MTTVRHDNLLRRLMGIFDGILGFGRISYVHMMRILGTHDGFLGQIMNDELHPQMIAKLTDVLNWCNMEQSQMIATMTITTAARQHSILLMFQKLCQCSVFVNISRYVAFCPIFTLPDN